MALFLICFFAMSLLVLAMSVGALAGRGPIKGSCGGMSALGFDTECEICGGDPGKCENNNETAKPGSDLAYDATAKKTDPLFQMAEERRR